MTDRPKTAAEVDRARRLAEALRANLRRRKAGPRGPVATQPDDRVDEPRSGEA